MKASEIKLQKVLEGTQQYIVPLFQRSYSWQRQQWQILWDDILELSQQEEMKPHFLGSIVTMPIESGPEEVAKYLLVDGQQRLTTIFILLAVLRDRAKQKPETKPLAEEIYHTLLVNYFKDKLPKLQPSKSDLASFYNLLQEEPKGEKNHILNEENPINSCYHFFDKKTRSLPEKNFQRIKKAITSGLSIVSITLDNDENPYLVFESLNAKGKPLTQADLIRNYLFMQFDVDRQEELYAQYWEPMQNALEETLTEYIRHYLMKDGQDIKQNEVYFILKDKVKHKNALEYLQKLAQFANNYYLKLVEPKQESDGKIRSFLMRLQQLEVTTAYPFLLNCYDDYDHQELSHEDFVQILAILENYIIRRFVCNIPTSTLNKIFPKLYVQVKDQSTLSFVESLKSILQDKNYPKDEKFTKMFQEKDFYGSVKSPTNKKAQLILKMIEDPLGSPEKGNLDHLQIEHIMPKKLTPDWQEHLGQNWQTTHKELLHTIGNLTLIGYNPELPKANFYQKRQILFSSDLKLNKYFADQHSWTKKDIEERSQYLAQEALKIWPYFGDELVGKKESDNVTGTKPKYLYLLGEKHTVKQWRDVLEKTMNFVAELDPEKFREIIENYPRYLGWDQQNFLRSVKLVNGAFVELNHSASNIKKFCLKVMKDAGLTSDDWRVETWDD